MGSRGSRRCWAASGRFVKFSAYALVVGLSGLALPRAAQAADGPVDDGLLEFLGSVDSEDKHWHDYLVGTDIDQVARRAAHASPSEPPPSPPAADAPEAAEPPASSAAPLSPP